MALTKQQKQDVISEVTELLDSSKLTVVAKYQGTAVKALQTLRRDAKADGTKVKIVKNRLVIQALKGSKAFKDTDTSGLEGMLLYAFNDDDEVAAARNLRDFAKQNPTLEFVGAFTTEGEFIDAASVKALAVLPSKPQLIAGVIAILQSPLLGVTGSLSGNLHGLLQGLEAKAAN